MEDGYVTKAMLLAGAKYWESVETPDGAFKVRGITELEDIEIVRVQFKGIKGKGSAVDPEKMEMETSIDLIQAQSMQAELMKLAYGLSADGEKWTPNEVGKMQFKLGTKPILLAAMDRLSGKFEAPSLDTFPKDPGGEPTGDADSDGGDEAGGVPEGSDPVSD